MSSSRSIGLVLVAAGLLLGIVYTTFTLREMATLGAAFGQQSAAVGRRALLPGLIAFNLVALVMIVVGMLLVRGGRRARRQIEVRPVAPEEHEQLGELTVAAYRQILGDGLTPEYAAELRDVSARAAAAQVLVAVADGRLAGGVTYVGELGPWAAFDDPDAAGIRMLAVDPAAQGSGVGTALVRACLQRARDDGRRRVVLHTTASMQGAERLYQRLGFTRDESRDLRPTPDVELRAYVHELAG